MSKDTTEDEEKTKPDTSSDEDDDYDDDYDTSEGDDQENDEPAKKGVDREQEVAVIDGDTVMAAIETTCQNSVEKAIGENFAPAVQQAVDAVLANKDYQEKQRAMSAGQINKALDLRFAGLTKALEGVEALTKAIQSGDALTKGIAAAAEEAAKTTPATKILSEEVLDKGIGSATPAAAPVNVGALMKEGLDLQMEKSIHIPLLDTYSMLGVAEKHEASNVAQLQKAIADAKAL